MSDHIYRNPKNIIFEMYQPTESGNVDPKRPPRGGSVLVPSRFKRKADTHKPPKH